MPSCRALFAAALVACAACAPSQPEEHFEGPSDVESRLDPPPVLQATVRFANDNIQWFGSTESGPIDEALQLERAAEVMRETDADVWVLCEIVGEDQFTALLAALPGYEGFLADDPSVQDGS